MKNSSVKVSVIVPVYNVEKYLRGCLDSILHQTLEDIEVICVNDGSTDSSGEILDEYSARDSRVVVIHKENMGYGHTMNIGISNARGEYIGIVESDDKIRPEMYECLYQCAVQEKVDFVKADYFECYESTNGQERIEYKKIFDSESSYEHVEDVKKELAIFLGSKCNWTGVYNTKFIRDNNIWHHESPGASYQDVGFWFQTYIRSRRAFFLKKAFYLYRIDNPNSSTNCTGNGNAIIVEYNHVRNILNQMGQEGKEYYNLYTLLRLRDCASHIERVSWDLKLKLAEQIRWDYMQAIRNRELDAYLFPEYWQKEIFKIAACPQKYCDMQKEEVDRIVEITKGYREIIIYGAGVVGRGVHQRLRKGKSNYKVQFFAVTSMEGQGTELLGIEVKPIDELTSYRKEALVIISVSQKWYQEMENRINQLGFLHYINARELFKS